MLPAELITMGGSFLVGLIGRWFTMKQETRKLELEILQAKHDMNMEARTLIDGSEKERERFQWTRRTIAITVVLTVLVLPKIATMWLDIPVIYAWVQQEPGFLWFSGQDVQHFTIMRGLTVLPYESHALYAVIGLYFGKGR